MAQGFLASSVLPGAPIQEHHHKRLVLALVLLVLIAIGGGVFAYISSKSNPSKVAGDLVHNETLGTVAYQFTHDTTPAPSVETKKVIEAQFNKPVAPVTASQQAAIRKQFQTER